MSIKTGKHTYGHNNITVLNKVRERKITIGSFCSIAASCKAILGVEHRTDYVSTYPFGNIGNWKVNKEYKHPISKGDIIICNDVWIGYNVTILSGVTIGNGAVIGANAVVSKDVEPYSIVAGNPAREIKKRFSDEQIESLLKIAWWKWPDNEIQENMHLLMNTDINQFIKRHI